MALAAAQERNYSEVDSFRHRAPMPSLKAELDTLELPDQLVDRSLQHGWLDEAKKTLSGKIEIPQMWEEARRLIDAATESLELIRYDVRSAQDLEARRRASYYSMPVMPAWKDDADSATPLLLPSLQPLLIDELGLKTHAPLIVPQSVEDLERIGNSRDIFSSVFWEEIRALYNRQQPWTPAQRLESLILTGGESDRAWFRNIRDFLGQNIHGLAAKDTTGRWAYYWVHVLSRDEPRFLDAIGTDTTIDLEDYGYVVASEYQATFRARQTAQYGVHFKERLEAYARFAERHRIYSLGSTDASEPRSFQKQRLERAIADPGSREAFADELARRAAELGVLPTEAAPPPPLSPYGIVPEAAHVVLEVFQQRRLGIHDLSSVESALIAPPPAELEAILQPMRIATQLLGRDSEAFDRFYLLVCSHRRLTAPALIGEALRLARKRGQDRGAAKAVSPILRLVPLLGSLGAIGAALASFKQPADTLTLPEPQLIELRRSMALFDVMMQLSKDNAAPLLECVKAYCTSEEPDAQSQAFASAYRLYDAICLAIRRDKETLRNEEEIRKSGVRVAYNISARLAEVAVAKDDGARNRLFLLAGPFSSELRSLSIIGRVIEEQPYSEKRKTLESLIRDSFDNACTAANYPPEKREALLSALIDNLLIHDRDQQPKAWTERVQESRTAAPTRPALPETAPATWQEDRQPEETPPAFIQRTYGAFLRADGSGLSRADIRRLDFKLYTALANWLRKNQLPDDVPIPKLSEQIDRDLQRPISDFNPKELPRLGQAMRRRASRNQ